MVLGMPDITPAEIKAAMKEAIKEWMDDKFADLGKWTLGGLAVSVLGGIGAFILFVYAGHK